MSTFEIGFLHKNEGVDFRDDNNKKPWYRGSLKIDGEEIRVVVFSSERNGKKYLTIKPDRPNPNAQGNSNRPVGGSGGAKRYANAGQPSLDDDVPF